MGNSAAKIGYGCQLPAMVAEWRRLWSATAGTTDPLAPFGVVSLAAGGSEGHPDNMAGMRWSQTANFGELPNPALPGGFLAHACEYQYIHCFCLPVPKLRLTPNALRRRFGRPHGQPAPSLHQRNGRQAERDGLRPRGRLHLAECFQVEPGCGPAQRGRAAKLGSELHGGESRSRVSRLLLQTVLVDKLRTVQGIHPRFKHEVGRRLALAYRGALTPTIRSCAAKEGEIDLVWTVAENDEAIVQWGAEDSNMSASGVQDSSGLMVCVGKPSAETTADDCLTDASLWVSAPLVAKTVRSAGGGGQGRQPVPATQQTLTAKLNGTATPLAVRYGWPLGVGGVEQGDTCCPFKTVTDGRQPCVP